MTDVKKTNDINSRLAAAWNALLAAESEVAVAMTRCEGARTRYDALLREKRGESRGVILDDEWDEASDG